MKQTNVSDEPFPALSCYGKPLLSKTRRFNLAYSNAQRVSKAPRKLSSLEKLNNIFGSNSEFQGGLEGEMVGESQKNGEEVKDDFCDVRGRSLKVGLNKMRTDVLDNEGKISVEKSSVEKNSVEKNSVEKSSVEISSGDVKKTNVNVEKSNVKKSMNSKKSNVKKSMNSTKSNVNLKKSMAKKMPSNSHQDLVPMEFLKVNDKPSKIKKNIASMATSTPLKTNTVELLNGVSLSPYEFSFDKNEGDLLEPSKISGEENYQDKCIDFRENSEEESKKPISSVVPDKAMTISGPVRSQAKSYRVQITQLRRKARMKKFLKKESRTLKTRNKKESQTLKTQNKKESQTLKTQNKKESQTLKTQNKKESQTLKTQNKKESLKTPKNQNKKESQTPKTQNKKESLKSPKNQKSLKKESLKTPKSLNQNFQPSYLQTLHSRTAEKTPLGLQNLKTNEADAHIFEMHGSDSDVPLQKLKIEKICEKKEKKEEKKEEKKKEKKEEKKKDKKRVVPKKIDRVVKSIEVPKSRPSGKRPRKHQITSTYWQLLEKCAPGDDLLNIIKRRKVKSLKDLEIN